MWSGKVGKQDISDTALISLPFLSNISKGVIFSLFQSSYSKQYIRLIRNNAVKHDKSFSFVIWNMKKSVNTVEQMIFYAFVTGMKNKRQYQKILSNFQCKRLISAHEYTKTMTRIGWQELPWVGQLASYRLIIFLCSYVLIKRGIWKQNLLTIFSKFNRETEGINIDRLYIDQNFQVKLLQEMYTEFSHESLEADLRIIGWKTFV